jgi:transcriptional regulator with XRE-family HTH domain
VSTNGLGDLIRERRQELGLTQEELAERMGGSASQAEISRLERGSVSLPRRARLDALAAALEISTGVLLMQSGWLSQEEGDDADATSEGSPQSDTADLMTTLAEMEHIRTILLTAVERVSFLEKAILASLTTAGRPDGTMPAGVGNDSQISAMSEAQVPQVASSCRLAGGGDQGP